MVDTPVCACLLYFLPHRLNFCHLIDLLMQYADPSYTCLLFVLIFSNLQQYAINILIY